MHWWPTQHDIIADIYRIKGKLDNSKIDKFASEAM